jgi:hypothetical protein
MLNVKKTKIMTTGTLNEFILDGTETEIINCYTFLSTTSPEMARFTKKSIEDFQVEEWQ